MKFIAFDSPEQYREAQRRSDCRKSRRTSALPGELDRIAEYYKRAHGNPRSGICHGARSGREVVMFRERFPEAKILGTDLFPREADYVVEWDFHDRREEWVGAFDFLYSNSLDHSHSPRECVSVWLEQLRPRGLAFIQWNDRNIAVRGGDCFGAALHEYFVILGEVGTVIDLLWCGGKSHLVSIVVGSKEKLNSRRRKGRRWRRRA